MHITSDNFMLFPALLCVIGACIAYLAAGLISGEQERARALKAGRWLYYASAALIVYATIYLLQQILSGHRYDMAYAYYNSGPKDSLLYKVSALWAGQEGSLLFWAAVAGLAGVAFVRAKDKVSPFLIAFWCLVQIFFLVMLRFWDPFAQMKDFMPGMAGSGMNPLLKNPWMAIHPPIVFIGYALLAVPAAFAVQALIDGDGSDWVRRCLPWALMGWVSFTAGIALGMIWSYEVLGWGGYWAWDPVENASLIPWLVSTTLVHGLVLQRYRGKMSRANLVLAAATFLTVILATFITRSGLLSQGTSVHAFDEAKDAAWQLRFFWLRGFSAAFAVLLAGLLLVRSFAVPVVKRALGSASRDLALIIGVVVTSLFAAFVIIGVCVTTFKEVPLKPTFYTDMSILPAIAIVALLGLTPLLKWNKNGESDSRGALLLNLFGAAILIAMLCAMGVAASGKLKILSGPGVPRALFTLQVGLLILCSIGALIASVWTAKKLSFIRSGAYLAHAGVAIMIIGIVASSHSTQTKSLLTKDNPRSVAGYSLTYEGIKDLRGGRQAMMLRVDNGKSSFTAPVEFEQSSRGAVFKPFIKSSIKGDLYISGDPRMQVIVPTLSVMEDRVVSTPAKMPDSDAIIDVVGIDVGSRMVKMQYKAPGRSPQDFMIGEGHPAEVDGYQIAFQDFTQIQGDHTSMGAAGVQVVVTGQKMVVSLSTKPFIYLVWAGLVLIMLGGGVAARRRWTERMKPADGILPDSGGSN